MARSLKDSIWNDAEFWAEQRRKYLEVPAPPLLEERDVRGNPWCPGCREQTIIDGKKLVSCSDRPGSYTRVTNRNPLRLELVPA